MGARGCDGWACLKLVELILCIICLLYKKWSDEEASRLFYINEKASTEWPLLNKVTWGEAGSLFADVTYGSYVIITFALLIGHCVGELEHSRRTESILMGLGALLFIGVGCLEICGVDLLQHELVDNAIILGILSIFTGMIFLFDIGNIQRRNSPKTSNFQTQNLRIAQERTGNKHPAIVPEKPTEETKVEVITSNPTHVQTNGHMNGGHIEDTTKLVQKEFKKVKNGKNAKNRDGSRADIVISNPMQVSSYPMNGAALALDVPDYEVKMAERPKNLPVANGYPMAGMVPPMGELRSSLRKRMERQEQNRRFRNPDEGTVIEMDLRKIDGSEILHRRSSTVADSPYASDKDHTHSTYYDSKEHTKVFSPARTRSPIREVYEPTRFKDVYFERHTGYDHSFRGLTQEKRLLSKSLDDNMIDVRLQSPTITSSQKTPPRQSPAEAESSDDSVNMQLPSVSYLLAERAKKVLPTVAQSPVERVSEPRETTIARQNKDKYYYGLQMVPGEPQTGTEFKSSPKSPRDPGYVLHTASKWPTAKVTDADSKFRWGVNAKTQNMR